MINFFFENSDSKSGGNVFQRLNVRIRGEHAWRFLPGQVMLMLKLRQAHFWSEHLNPRWHRNPVKVEQLVFSVFFSVDNLSNSNLTGTIHNFMRIFKKYCQVSFVTQLYSTDNLSSGYSLKLWTESVMLFLHGHPKLLENLAVLKYGQSELPTPCWCSILTYNISADNLTPNHFRVNVWILKTPWTKVVCLTILGDEIDLWVVFEDAHESLDYSWQVWSW